MSEALVPAAAATPAVTDRGAAGFTPPQVIVDAGPDAVAKFLEFFAGGSRTSGCGRRTGGPWGSFWRGARPRPGRGVPAPRGRLHPDPLGIGPDRQAGSRGDPHALRLARHQPVLPASLAAAVRGRSTSSRRVRRRSSRRPKRGSSSTASTRAFRPGSGTARSSASCSTASLG